MQSNNNSQCNPYPRTLRQRPNSTPSDPKPVSSAKTDPAYSCCDSTADRRKLQIMNELLSVQPGTVMHASRRAETELGPYDHSFKRLIYKL